MFDYEKLPEHMREGMKLYVEEGIATGSFMNAVLENDLVHSFAYADEDNLASMFEWAGFLHWELPTPAWGSKAKVNAWKKAGGIKANA